MNTLEQDTSNEHTMILLAIPNTFQPLKSDTLLIRIPSVWYNWTMC